MFCFYYWEELGPYNWLTAPFTGLCCSQASEWAALGFQEKSCCCCLFLGVLCNRMHLSSQFKSIYQFRPHFWAAHDIKSDTVSLLLIHKLPGQQGCIFSPLCSQGRVSFCLNCLLNAPEWISNNQHPGLFLTLVAVATQSPLQVRWDAAFSRVRTLSLNISPANAAEERRKQHPGNCFSGWC